jgi:hypothetical protein
VLVDHYLGKRALTALPALRQALGPPLARASAAAGPVAAQVVLAEAEALAGRTSFYSGVGVVRDVLQSHAMQMAAAALAPVGGEGEGEGEDGEGVDDEGLSSGAREAFFRAFLPATTQGRRQTHLGARTAAARLAVPCAWAEGEGEGEGEGAACPRVGDVSEQDSALAPWFGQAADFLWHVVEEKAAAAAAAAAASAAAAAAVAAAAAAPSSTAAPTRPPPPVWAGAKMVCRAQCGDGADAIHVPGLPAEAARGAVAVARNASACNACVHEQLATMADSAAASVGGASQNDWAVAAAAALSTPTAARVVVAWAPGGTAAPVPVVFAAGKALARRVAFARVAIASVDGTGVVTYLLQGRLPVRADVPMATGPAVVLEGPLPPLRVPAPGWSPSALWHVAANSSVSVDAVGMPGLQAGWEANAWAALSGGLPRGAGVVLHLDEAVLRPETSVDAYAALLRRALEGRAEKGLVSEAEALAQWAVWDGVLDATAATPYE